MAKQRGRVRWLLGVLGVALVVHLAVVFLYPYLVTDYLYKRLIERTGRNTLHHAHQPTPQDREVPMPSPDLIYSAGAYDVTQHPLHITAPLTGSYLSLSLYADNMDNFFVQNDRQVQHHQFDVIVVGPGDPLPHATGSLVVRAPSATGIILFRCFAGTRLALRKVADVQQQIHCTIWQ